MTDVIPVTDGWLAGLATFPASGVGKCHTVIWHAPHGNGRWSVRSNLTEPEENLGNEVALLETEPGTVLCLLRDRRNKDTYRQWSHDGGRSWTTRERLSNILGGILQRPVLTRLDERTILLSARDAMHKMVVLYLSRDNGQTFKERHVVDTFQSKGEGGYTTTIVTGPRHVLMSWYTDEASDPLKPDIKFSRLAISDKPTYLWIRLPQDTEVDTRIFVYHGNRRGVPAESRTGALIRPAKWGTAKLGEPERISEH